VSIPSLDEALDGLDELVRRSACRSDYLMALQGADLRRSTAPRQVPQTLEAVLLEPSDPIIHPTPIRSHLSSDLSLGFSRRRKQHEWGTSIQSGFTALMK
jgi:hypothetical protein